MASDEVPPEENPSKRRRVVGASQQPDSQGAGARQVAQNCSVCANALDMPSVEAIACDERGHDGLKRATGACGHVFHLDCVGSAVQGNAGTCPLCREPWEATDTTDIDVSVYAAFMERQLGDATECLTAGGDSCRMCAICLEQTSLEPDAAHRTAFLGSCGHCFCHTCIVRALQTRPRCPTCRAPADVGELRVPERVGAPGANEAEVFRVNLRKLTGKQTTVRCSMATTVEALKEHFIAANRMTVCGGSTPYSTNSIKFIWGRTTLVNGNTLGAYGIHNARIPGHPIIPGGQRYPCIHVVLSALQSDDPLVERALAYAEPTPQGTLEVTVKDLTGRVLVIGGLASTTTFSDLQDAVQEQRAALGLPLGSIPIRFIFAGVQWSMDKRLGDARVCSPSTGSSVVHAVYSIRS